LVKEGRAQAVKPRSDYGRRQLVKLRELVYRAHNPRWAFAPTCGDGWTVWPSPRALSGLCGLF
jgi:hypothetical protein